MNRKDEDAKGQSPEDLSKDQNSEPSKGRRRLLGKLALGGAAGAALPTTWTKPVVNSVVLPAHAQVSPGLIIAGGGGSRGPGPGPAPSTSPAQDVLDFFINPAQAVPVGLEDYCVEITIATGAGGEVTAVNVIKYCYNACKPGKKWFDKTDGSVPLEKKGENFAGGVGGYEMTISEIRPGSSPVAKVSWDGIGGQIFEGGGCDCSCASMPV